jgi:hypothetical protein
LEKGWWVENSLEEEENNENTTFKGSSVKSDVSHYRTPYIVNNESRRVAEIMGSAIFSKLSNIMNEYLVKRIKDNP